MKANKQTFFIGALTVSIILSGSTAYGKRKIASDQYTNISAQTLEEMTAEDIESLLDVKQNDLERAQEIISSGQKIDLPTGVMYKLPEVGVVIGAIGSAGALVGSVYTYSEIRKSEGALKSAEEKKAAAKIDRKPVKSLLNDAKKALAAMDKELGGQSKVLMQYPTKKLKKLVEDRKTKKAEHDLWEKELQAIVKGVQETSSAVNERKESHEKVMKKYGKVFKGSAGFSAGFVAVAIGGLAADFAIKRDNTTQITEDEKAQLEMTANLLANEIEIMKLAIRSRDAKE